ncbi:MAG TPA: polyprenyl synthetase family protein, partial [Acidimicrobiales bacterium]|nr:polyprenyl synthetase family protein [Acidimicrobiales bacterium]
ALVRPGLESAMRRVAPELRDAVGGHLASGGKMLRAALVLLSAAACGGDEAGGVDGAVAIELVHNFSLVHDDVIDGDVERRHRPTVWAAHGVDHAIIAGDALATVAFQVLLEVPSAERANAASLLADATQAMIAGQAQDMALERRATATLAECLEMVSGKTAALVRCAACLGAVLSGAPDPSVSALWEFGHHLGIAFQAVDDLLGIWGETGATGKPVGNDLRRRKKTIPVCIATSQGVALPACFTSTTVQIGDREVDELRELLEACGARAATVDLSERHARDALAALDRVELAPRPRAQLGALASFCVDRDR